LLRNLSLKFLFASSILVTALLSIAIEFFVLDEITQLSEVSNSIYRHPFAVSNAVREARNHITAIHRNMKDVVLADDEQKLEQAINSVDEEELHIYEDFELIKERFLGSRKLIENVTSLIDQWRPIRSEVIQLVRDGRVSEAADITRGKGAEHVQKIEKSMHALLDFANNKADQFLQQSKEVSTAAYRNTIVLLSILIVVVLLVNIAIYRILSGQLKSLADSTDAITAGDYSKPVPITSSNEIGMLAQKFEQMRFAIKSYVEKIKYAKQEAEYANQEKSRFLANMSHELRTPMHSIMSFSHLALKKIDNRKKTEEFLNNIHQSGERLTGLLNDLLDLSKMEAGKMQVDLSEQDIVELIERAGMEVSSLLIDKNIQLQINADEHYLVKVDPKLIIQVMINLLSNAIKFSPQHSLININVSKKYWQLVNRRYDLIEIVVIDEGTGIESEELGSVFDKFTQSKNHQHTKGTGLGLSITREIVALHHGEIWAESPARDSDRGTAIYIRIPVMQEVPGKVTVTNIQEAIDSHRDWVGAIDAIYASKHYPTEIPNTVIANENICALGQWLNAGLVEGEDVEELKKAHREFHFLAGECAAYCELGDFERAGLKHRNFKSMSGKVLEHLDALKSSWKAAG
jgi:signal transduction histidine kinase